MQFNLSKEGAVLNQSYTIIVRAIDSVGNVFDGNFSVKYGYKLPTSARWVVLTERGSNKESVVHMITGTDTSNFKVYEDCAAQMTVPVLGTGPKRIFYADNGMNVFGLVQESNKMTMVHPYTFATYRSLEQLFQGGVVPAGVAPQYDLVVNGSLGVLWNSDGKLYSKIILKKANALQEKYSEKTLHHEDGSEVNCEFILTRDDYPSARKDFVIYDKTKKGFYLVCGQELKSAGKVVPVLGPVNSSLPEPCNLDGYEVLFAESCSYQMRDWYAIIRKDGKTYFYTFNFATADYHSTKTARATAVTMKEITDYPGEFPEDKKLYDWEFRGSYCFFVPKSDKKSIYYYDKSTNRVGIYMKFEGGDDITRIYGQYTSSSQTRFGVGVGNKFYIMNISASYMGPTVAYENKIVGEFELDGKVVDFFYR